jgi:rubredoxin
MTSTESVADPITALPETHRCPACGERKQRLAQH